jgi:hypothetical protein
MFSVVRKRHRLFGVELCVRVGRQVPAQALAIAFTRQMLQDDAIAASNIALRVFLRFVFISGYKQLTRRDYSIRGG